MLPLRIGERVIGALSLSFREDRTCAPDEQAFLQTVADLCAPALDRARLHREVERQRAWEGAVHRHSSDIVTVLDGGGTILYESGSVERILGYRPEELVGQSVFSILHPADRASTRSALGRLGGEGTLTVRRFLHKAGHWVWLESVATDLRNHEHIRGVLVNTRDVSARLEAEAERQAQARALAESERHFRLLADNAGDLVMQFSPQGRPEYCSPSARELLGREVAEVLALDPLELVWPEDRPRLLALFGPSLPLGESSAEGSVPLEYRLRRPDGTSLWVETVFRAVRDPETGEVVALSSSTRDIEARKRAERDAEAQLARYRQLLEFTAALELESDPARLVQQALERCLALTEYDYGSALDCSAGPLSAEPQVVASAGHTPSWPGGTLRALGGMTFSPALMQAWSAQEPLFLAEDEAVLDPPEPLPRPRWRTFCLLPVPRSGRPGLLLAFGTARGVKTSEDTRQLLVGVAARLRRALERAEHLAQLATSREETLRALGLALEYRDYETKGHTDRVVALADRLGRALGFGDGSLDALRWGAFLHDTGKVAIPDAILLKPGKLTPEEWGVIRRHPTIGFEMLQHIPSLPPETLEVVLHHQERWNGSGYPAGLSGGQIPIAARVFAVVDVYDALTSERPYKAAWSRDQAAAQLRREAGVLLDREVVDTFLRLLEEGD